MPRPVLLWALALIVFAPSTGCVLAPPLYWAEAIHGKVVDADTGRPIEGAVVVADWKLYGGGIGHGGHRDSLLKEEILTDANGHFAFGTWGPRMRPAFQILDKGPNIVVFKRLYDVESLWNESDSNGPVRRSDWNDTTIHLRKFVGRVEMRVQRLDGLLRVGTPLLLQEVIQERPLRQDWPAGTSVFGHARWLLEGAPR